MKSTDNNNGAGTGTTGAQRRRFLSGLAAFGASAMIPGCASNAPAPGAAGAKLHRIDIHHHAFPPMLVAELAARKLANTFASNWSVARTLGDMDRAGVATSILSFPNPGLSFAEAPLARRLARENNEYLARLAADYPGRFGFFGLLPVQDIDGSLREIEYALDVLKAQGIGMLTNYGDQWLGHKFFAPIMDELNRRKAVLYTHPTLASCCRNLLPDVPPTVIEYGTDTTRTIADIVFSGTAARCPDLRFIFSHGGGSLPYLTERFEMMPVLDPRLRSRVPNGVLHELQRFYYDTAWLSNPVPLAALTRFVPISRILFGSDYPYRTGAETVKGLVDFGFSASDLHSITRGNALQFLPPLKA